ncbi:MAG: hypothetical protein GEU77_16865 [Deltaproteobacteria bacterium]|nr:hypothetical protein [Deltaproteobacteria bacterium]
MKNTDKLASRLALLEEVSLSPADVESIIKDIEDNERVVAELEEFSQGIPWVTMQLQPTDKKG